MSKIASTILNITILVTIGTLVVWQATGGDYYTKYEFVQEVETAVDPNDPLADAGFYEGSTARETVVTEGLRLGLLPTPAGLFDKHMLSVVSIITPFWALTLLVGALAYRGRRRAARAHTGIAGIVLAAIIAAMTGATTTATTSPATDGLGEFTALLKDHVREGHVDYASICRDERLDQYTRRLSAVVPEKLTSDEERLAFWINVYNAFTLQIVCSEYPIESINDLHFGGLVVGTVLKKTVWDKKFVVIDGEKLSLNNIEHDIIRKQYEDARVHFALVCASKSCPALRSEAFDADRLDIQLDDQARGFFADESRNRFDTEQRIAYLNKILDWYSGDFGENDRDILLYVANYLEVDLAESIRANIDGWKVKHVDYDWSLND